MASSTNPYEVDYLRDRVRLYLQVMLSVDIGTEVIGAILTALFAPDAQPDFPGALAVLRWSTTGLIAAAWAWTKFWRPGRLALLTIEAGVTATLSALYITVTSIIPVHGPNFALLCIVLALMLRAALVPSPVPRTLGLGAICVGMLVALNWHLLDTSPDQQLPILALPILGGAFVAISAVTSHVIYGLQRQVRDAMRLGQYELVRKLGEGGMGIVYEATHVMLRRPTAVKLLPIEKAGEQTVARFEREVQQTSRLEHPNSVYIYDYGRTPDGQFYYAMEYLDGVTLEELVALDGPVTPARVVDILRQAARALAEAHAIGLVHRDIKPANIMLCQRAQVPDTVKVLDFGLVKAIDNPEVDANITHADTVVGTPHYLAPEAISSPDDVGPASDVYALGAVGFFLLTGREVFPGKKLIEVCSAHLSTPPPVLSEVRGEALDSELEALIDRCLRKAPEERPLDGAALAVALGELQLSGWDAQSAQQWWAQLPERRAKLGTRAPSERTQLAIDMGARR